MPAKGKPPKRTNGRLKGNGTGHGWPGAEIWPLDRIKPYPNNPRTHPEAQIAVLADLLAKFGPDQPIVVDEAGVVLKGHGRLEAARRAGLTGFPVAVRHGLTEPEKITLRISDNQVAALSGWDRGLLRTELSELQLVGYDTALLGFEKSEIAGYLVEPSSADPEATPEPPEKPISVLGDLWLLGEHRLLCGDSTSADDTKRVMDDATPSLIFTSPPYAQQRDYGAAKEAVQDWDKLMRGVFAAVPTNDQTQILVNLGQVHRDGEWVPYWDAWIEWMRESGWRRFGWYVWDKLAGLPGDFQGRLAPAHEWIFHFNKTSRRPNKTKAKLAGSIEYNSHGSGLRSKDGSMSGVSNRVASLQTHKIPDSVFRVVPHKARGGANATHPAMFPVLLAQEAIDAFSNREESVYEPFSGSGTTIIAAEMTGRKCCALEIDPAYIDVAIRRWQTYTGKQATLEGDGRTFDEIAKERGKPHAARHPRKSLRGKRTARLPAPLAKPPLRKEVPPA